MLMYPGRFEVIPSPQHLDDLEVVKEYLDVCEVDLPAGTYAPIRPDDVGAVTVREYRFGGAPRDVRKVDHDGGGNVRRGGPSYDPRQPWKIYLRCNLLCASEEGCVGEGTTGSARAPGRRAALRQSFGLAAGRIALLMLVGTSAPGSAVGHGVVTSRPAA